MTMMLKPLLNQQLLLLLTKVLQLMWTQDVPVQVVQPVTVGSAVQPASAVHAFPKIQISI